MQRPTRLTSSHSSDEVDDGFSDEERQRLLHDAGTPRAGSIAGTPRHGGHQLQLSSKDAADGTTSMKMSTPRGPGHAHLDHNGAIVGTPRGTPRGGAGKGFEFDNHQDDLDEEQKKL